MKQDVALNNMWLQIQNFEPRCSEGRFTVQLRLFEFGFFDSDCDLDPSFHMLMNWSNPV